MSDPIEFYRSFQALLRGRAITGVLTSGMACVEYGIQQNTKDTDWIIAPGDIGSLVTLFGELERGISGSNWRVSYRGLFGAPLDFKYLDGGWTSHLAAFDRPESAERHLDFFGRPPRVGETWRNDTNTGIASRDIVARMKKTDQPKDWPLVNALAIQAYYSGDAAGTGDGGHAAGYDSSMTNEQTNPTGEPGHPADPVYPERYYEILARDLGEDKARWARLPYAERMRELAWYHAHFNTPDDLSPWPAELDGGVDRG